MVKQRFNLSDVTPRAFRVFDSFAIDSRGAVTAFGKLALGYLVSTMDPRLLERFCRLGGLMLRMPASAADQSI